MRDRPSDQQTPPWVSASETDIPKIPKRVEGMNTTGIMIGLFRSLNKVPNTIPNGDPDLKKMVAETSRLTTLLNSSQTDPGLNTDIDNIQTAIGQLAANTKNASAAQMATLYTQQFLPLKMEGKERMAQINDLVREVKELVQEKIASFTIVIAEKVKKTTPRSQIAELLNQGQKKMGELLKRKESIKTNTDLLRKKLFYLNNETKSAAKASGVQAEIQVPEKPTQPRAG